MAVLTWGDLAKSQVDDETIEEAIARIVAEHNADEEAHLAAGQSLQSHKASEIIDHLASSVVADKISGHEAIFEGTFQSLDCWTITGIVELAGWGNVNVFVDDEGGLSARIRSLVPVSTGFLNLGKDILWQLATKLAHTGNVTLLFGIQQALGSTPSKGFGFYHNATNFRAYYHDGSVAHYSSAITTWNNAPHVFRVVNVASDHTLYYYIDDALVWSYNYTSAPAAVSAYCFFDSVAQAGESSEYTLYRFLCSFPTG